MLTMHCNHRRLSSGWRGLHSLQVIILCCSFSRCSVSAFSTTACECSGPAWLARRRAETRTRAGKRAKTRTITREKGTMPWSVHGTVGINLAIGSPTSTLPTTQTRAQTGGGSHHSWQAACHWDITNYVPLKPGRWNCAFKSFKFTLKQLLTSMLRAFPLLVEVDRSRCFHHSNATLRLPYP
jgi:hypothetical protein